MKSEAEVIHDAAMDLARQAFAERGKSASLHRSAMERTQEAVLTENPERARELFSSALALERRAAEIWEETRNEEPTRSILYRSAASLAWSCEDYPEVVRLARKGLEGSPPGDIVAELKELLDMVSRKKPPLATEDSPSAG